MNIYVILTGLIIFLGIILRGDRPESRAFIFAACFALFFVLGFRDCMTVGNDSSTSYLHAFQRMETTEWSELPFLFAWGRNAGFHRLMKLVSDLTGGEYQVFVVLCALTYMVPFTYLIYKYSVNPLQSILMFLGLMIYPLHFNTLKQSMAMGILLLAFDAVMERKPIRFVLLVLAAALFHFPAIVFLPAYLFARMRLGRRYLVMLGVLLVGVYLFRDQLLELMLSTYDTTIYETDMRFLANKVLIMLAITVMGVILREPRKGDDLYSALMSFMGVAIVLQTFAGYNNTFERLSNYYFQLTVLFLPLIFEHAGKPSRLIDEDMRYMLQNVAAVGACLFAVFRFIRSVGVGTRMLPYTFFFMK